MKPSSGAAASDKKAKPAVRQGSTDSSGSGSGDEKKELFSSSEDVNNVATEQKHVCACVCVHVCVCVCVHDCMDACSTGVAPIECTYIYPSIYSHSYYRLFQRLVQTLNQKMMYIIGYLVYV